MFIAEKSATTFGDPPDWLEVCLFSKSGIYQHIYMPYASKETTPAWGQLCYIVS